MNRTVLVTGQEEIDRACARLNDRVRELPEDECPDMQAGARNGAGPGVSRGSSAPTFHTRASRSNVFGLEWRLDWVTDVLNKKCKTCF